MAGHILSWDALKSHSMLQQTSRLPLTSWLAYSEMLIQCTFVYRELRRSPKLADTVLPLVNWSCRMRSWPSSQAMLVKFSHFPRILRTSSSLAKRLAGIRPWRPGRTTDGMTFKLCTEQIFASTRPLGMWLMIWSYCVAALWKDFRIAFCSGRGSVGRGRLHSSETTPLEIWISLQSLVGFQGCSQLANSEKAQGESFGSSQGPQAQWWFDLQSGLRFSLSHSAALTMPQLLMLRPCTKTCPAQHPAAVLVRSPVQQWRKDSCPTEDSGAASHRIACPRRQGCPEHVFKGGVKLHWMSRNAGMFYEARDAHPLALRAVGFWKLSNFNGRWDAS